MVILSSVTIHIPKQQELRSPVQITRVTNGTVNTCTTVHIYGFSVDYRSQKVEGKE